MVAISVSVCHETEWQKVRLGRRKLPCRILSWSHAIVGFRLLIGDVIHNYDLKPCLVKMVCFVQSTSIYEEYVFLGNLYYAPDEQPSGYKQVGTNSQSFKCLCYYAPQKVGTSKLKWVPPRKKWVVAARNVTGLLEVSGLHRTKYFSSKTISKIK